MSWDEDLSPSPEELARSGSLEELYARLARIPIGPGWNKPTPSLWDAPRKSLVPYRWRYVQGRGALEAAGRLINTELAERRNLILANPAGDGYATTRSMITAYQMIMPGERARSHRHMPNALRLVLESGPGCYTVVDGKRLEMEPGDVLLTPNWSWHGHGNESESNGYWADYLDVPLVHLLEPMFFEPHPKGFELDAPIVHDDPNIFRWQDTLDRLDAARPTPASRYATEIALGDPALDTMGLSMMRLEPGTSTERHRTTAGNIYTVAHGSGATEIDGQSFDWQHGDVIAVPAWLPHSHRANEVSVLFRVSDEPAMQKLGFLRSETASSPH
jgi:gentisate 1,2-dioxygenase